jgi:hypothetical protein
MPDARVKFVHLALIILFAATIGVNLFLARKVSKLAYDVEQLNRAYIGAIESMRGVSDAVDSLPAPRLPDENGLWEDAD